ncbi:MAG: DUF3108 domain-containing protein, partial [Pyrinomonadaceae bacterium]|nr:DUF3108 domain-containing protein [Pyrinomonadaceae bacterium]
MKTKKFAGWCLLIFNAFCVSIFAQTGQKIEPYNAGEKLAYEAKFSKIIKGIAVADLNFTVENTANDKDFLIRSDAVTKGSLLKLFSRKFVQKYESTVSGADFAVKRTVKRDEQGKRVRESEALFDYQAKKVIYMETDPNDAARPPRQIASPIPANTQDLVTAIYTLRRLPLVVGKTFELTVSDSGLVYKIPVRVVAREQQRTVLGKVWCFRVEPELFGANRIIEQKGSMILWITDDTRRLPVRSQINLNIGRFEVKLKKIEDKSQLAV